MNKSILFLLFFAYLCYFGSNLHAQAPGWSWAKSAGGAGADYGANVAVDASGDVYVTGYFNSSIVTFGSYPLTNGGMYDLFLVKYDGGGNVLWAKSAGGNGNDLSYSVAVDNAGNAYVTGTFTGSTITFDSYVLTNLNTGYDDIFFVKYDSDGNVLWAKSAGGTNADFGESVTVSASGSIYLTGGFSSTIISFGSYVLTNEGGTDMFIARYDTVGNVLWAHSTGGTGIVDGISAAAGASGSAFVTGDFIDSVITFGTYSLTNAGYDDMFIVKYDSNGNVLWAGSAGGTDADRPYCIAVDGSGNAFVTGVFASPAITFGSITLTNTNPGYIDIFLVKYDDSGNVLWATSIGTSCDEYGYSVAADGLGNAYITGMFVCQPMTFGSYTLTSLGGNDIFLAKYDGSGNVMWAKNAGGISEEAGFSVAVNASEEPFVTGWFLTPEINFGSDVIYNAGFIDMFLAKSDGFSVGIDETGNSLNISLYPDPASDKIRIAIPDGSTEGNLIIMNDEGQEVLQQVVKESPAIIDICMMPRGLYFVYLTGGQTVQVKKFIKY
jgi:hypothetical protein